MERALVVLLVGAVVAAVAAWLRWRERRVRAHVHVPGGPAVIAFTHRLCAPCRSQQLPALKRLQELVDSRVRVEVVDVERDPHLARRFGVFTVPSTVVVGPDGRVVAFNHGFADEARLLRQLGRTAPEGVPDLLRKPGPEVT